MYMIVFIMGLALGGALFGLIPGMILKKKGRWDLGKTFIIIMAVSGIVGYFTTPILTFLVFVGLLIASIVIKRSDVAGNPAQAQVNTPTSQTEAPVQPEPYVAPVQPVQTEPYAQSFQPVQPEPYVAPVQSAQPQTLMPEDVWESDDDEKTMFMPEELDKTVSIFSQVANNPHAYLIRRSDGARIDVEGTLFTLGKSRAHADYVVADSQRMSREHAAIMGNENGFGIKDDSKNGTWVNGFAADRESFTPLKDGDIIRLADVEFEFHQGK